MDCPQQIVTDSETAMLEFGQKILQRRVPLNGSIEITRQCNFNCVHCYLGGLKTPREMVEKELNTHQWITIIDEIVDAGCLFLLFTGGDPLIREDFIDIYCHAIMRGMIVTVFTNGSLVSDEIVEVFKKFPPREVGISVYGATPETYLSITGQTDGFEKTIAGIDKLFKQGIRIQLKTILMTKNQHEFDLIKKIAEDRKLNFRFDALIFPGLGGDQSPLKFRVSPETVVEKNLSSPERRDEWKNYYRRMKGFSLSEILYGCGAGLNTFHVNSVGELSPCIMTGHISYNLLEGSFTDGWENVIPKIKEKKIPIEFKCKNCKYHCFCGYCPAFFRLETGSETQISPYLCDIGHKMLHGLNVDE